VEIRELRELTRTRVHWLEDSNRMKNRIAQVCEAGNETYVPGQLEIGNLPASDVSNNREITKREDDLFGEKYSTTTLKALGIMTAQPKATAKGKGKAHGKAKAKGKGK